MKKIDKALDAFKHAGFAFDIRRFEDRLVAQKLVYLLQELGVKLGYEGTYSFYLRGTYSPTLTKDLFQPADSPAALSDVPLTATERQATEILRDATKLRPHILEVMAAYRFLKKQGKDDEDAIRLTKLRKPFISPRDIAIGVSKCKGLWSEVTDDDAQSLREEMDPWDRAASEDAR